MDDKPREELERRMDELAGSMQRPTSQYSKRKWKQSAAASLECWTTIRCGEHPFPEPVQIAEQILFMPDESRVRVQQRSERNLISQP